ncbi:ADAMTS-like protein 2, partial [Neolamprologus brichardi]|uniref:ADAMTS-like protein 2 n=1 Tax=Neolamprologus brichardi TaxID=32507 RepID=UPI001643C4E7
MFAKGIVTLPVSILLLHLPVFPLTDSWPVEDRSEVRVGQHDGHLRPHGSQNGKQTGKKEVFQWWGEWSTWSSCSRSCGGGVRSQERHCLMQRCPSTSVSFKQHQCSQFNSKAFGRRYYQWIPLYPADYISISNRPCDLQCTTISGERQLLVPAHDGTSCRDTKNHGVCIEGMCQTSTRGVMQYQCITIILRWVSLPQRSVLTRLSPRIHRDVFLLINSGSVFSLQLCCSSVTSLFLSSGYVFITNIPAGASDIQIIERHKTENILGENVQLLLQEEEEVVWEIQTARPAPVDIMVYRPADVITRVFSHNDVEEQGPPAPSGYKSSSNSSNEQSTEDDNTLLLTFPGDQRVRPAAEDAAYLLLEGTQTNTYSATEQRSVAAADTSSQMHRDIVMDSVASETVGGRHTAVLVELQQASEVQAANTESNNFDVEPHVSLGDLYSWKVSAYAPCSSTCTTGITSTYALCVRYDGTEVDDRYCDSLTRPEPTQEFCIGKQCPPRWETSGWSACSRTCGEGVQYRIVRCWKMLSPGFDSSVYDSLCLSHDLHKPANRKVCHGQSCGPQWEVSGWSECSARCGSRGIRTREVRCSVERKLCNETSRPIESQECDGPPCDRRWSVSDWGPCSGECGEGRMVRSVTCRSSGGLVMSDGQCDQPLRPLAIYPCGDRD